MDFEIPKSIKLEHEELHEDLEEATMEPGSVGDAAKAVQEVLQPHFLKEEVYSHCRHLDCYLNFRTVK